MQTNPASSAGDAGAPRPRGFARHLPTIARYLFGLVFLVFGLDGFFHFIPQPTKPMPEGAISFFMAMIKTGYLFQLVKGTEVVVGVMLLANRFVPLALVLIAPIVVNIVAFDTLLAPDGAVVGFVVLALELYLAWAYRSAYRPMLASRATPA